MHVTFRQTSVFVFYGLTATRAGHYEFFFVPIAFVALVGKYKMRIPYLRRLSRFCSQLV